MHLSLLLVACHNESPLVILLDRDPEHLEQGSNGGTILQDIRIHCSLDPGSFLQLYPQEVVIDRIFHDHLDTLDGFFLADSPETAKRLF